MSFTKFFSLFICSFLFQGIVSAQEWTSYQSPNQINDFVDMGGELFLATDAGLIVVNKSTLERTTFNTDNSSLSNNHIETITQGQGGSIWIGTYDVVMFQFDGSDFQGRTTPDNEELRSFTKLYDLKIAPNGDIWTATDDGVFHRQGETWLHYGSAEFGERFFESWDLDVRDNGDVLVVGREVHQFSNGEWTNLSESSGFDGYLDANIFTSSTGDLYVAGDLDSIFRFDGQDWESYELGFNGSQLLGFTEDTAGSVYFYTQRDGVFKLENNSWVQAEDEQTAGFSDVTASVFYIDEQNNRWLNRNIQLSVNEGGQIRSTVLADHMLGSNFSGRPIRGGNGKMYFPSYFYDRYSVVDAEGNWSLFDQPTFDSPDELLRDMLVLADDNILVSTNFGLHQFDGNEWTLVRSLDDGGKMVMDSQGRLYVYSTAKIYIIDNGVLSEYNTTNSPITSLAKGGYGIDANDNLWIASSEFEADNVIQTVTRDGVWTTYTMTDHPAITRPTGEFAFDSDGNAWIVNQPFGPLKFDGTEWTTPLREVPNDAITNKSIDAVTVDAAGKLYMAHAYGISTLMDGEIENFINEDVITNNSQDTYIEFNDAGLLWWANGRTGLFSFEPEVVSSGFSPSEAVVAGLKLYPNPAQVYTTVDFTTRASASVQVAVYNQIGQSVSTLDLGQLPEGAHQYEVNVDQLPTGFYTVQLRINGSSTTSKLIVE